MFGWGMLVVAGVASTLIGLKVISLPIREGVWETVSALAMGGVLTASGLYFVIDTIRTTGPWFLVFERGFGAGREVFPWDQVDAFFQLVANLNFSGIPLSLTEYTVRRNDGHEVQFSRGVCQAEVLAATIQERINPRLLAAARAAFVAGGDVNFGDVSVNPTGLRFTEVSSGQVSQVSWNAIQDVVAGGLAIEVRRVGESRLARFSGAGDSIATRRVANVMVFLTLVADILASRESM